MPKQVILLTNLGSPNSTRVNDVRKYLRRFLMDERVIDIPQISRWLLVNGIIAPFRAPRSASKYKKIWTPEGSPLIVITEHLAKKVELASEIPTYISMRYGDPSPESAFKAITTRHPEVKEVILFPLYPHYAMSSYETAVEYVKKIQNKGNWPFRLKVVEPYYNKPEYIRALCDSIRPFVAETFDHILFSYHGVPERHIRKTDPTGIHCLKSDDCCNIPSPAHEKCYRHQVFETTRLVVDVLKIPEQKYSVSFQSRLGSDKWLGPATSDVLSQLPRKGVKNLLVVTPAFVSDCLETLEEIRLEGKESFLSAGGDKFTAIPCLNINNEWVRSIINLIKSYG